MPAHIHIRRDHGFDLDVQVGARDGRERVLHYEPRSTMDERVVVQTSRWGLPALAPEAVIFYKSLDLRPHDHADFIALLPVLREEQSAWLRHAVAAVRPGHPWLKDLDWSDGIA